jgi:mono/diheme cytochrome c family protein
MRNTALALLLAGGALVGALACKSETKSPGSGAEPKAQASSATPASIENGQKIYKTYCTPCHGEGGQGDGPGAGAFKPPPRDHTDAAYMSTMTDEQLAQIITIGGSLRGKPAMPSNPQIRGDDLKSLVAFVRSLSQPGRPTRP